MKSRIGKIASKLLERIPESRLKNVIRSKGYNLFDRNDFFVEYHLSGNNWSVTSDSITVYFRTNPYHTFKTNNLFLRFFPRQERVDYIVDAGAYHGTFGLFLAKKFPETVVILLEPDPASFAVLQENVQLNELKNVILYQKGIWNREETLYFSQGHELGSFIIDDPNRETNVISIETTMPDIILKDISGKNVFIKMNIEGAELEAVPAFQSIWERNKLTMVVSTDHKVHGDEFTYLEIERFCSTHDLNCKTYFTQAYINTVISTSTIR